jgi:methyl-accepting chemotaxis protein
LHVAVHSKKPIMRNLSVYNRFAMITAVLTVVLVAVLASQVMVLRNTVIQERRSKVFDLVEAAKKILAAYDEKAKAGAISAEQARQLAFDAIERCAGANHQTISASMAQPPAMPG